MNSSIIDYIYYFVELQLCQNNHFYCHIIKFFIKSNILLMTSTNVQFKSTSVTNFTVKIIKKPFYCITFFREQIELTFL